MAFFDPNGNQLNIQQFINIYQPYYFLGSPNYHRRITRRNKTNIFVENQIEQILANGLRPNDIIFIIAWKIGAVDHINSNNQIQYRQNFNNTLQFQTQFNLIDVNHLVNYIQNNFILLQSQNNYSNLFNLIYNNRGPNSFFGLVYCLTIVYFFSQGVCPIYDKYADIAIKAHLSNITPNNPINYRQISNYQDYINFSNNLTAIFGNQNISRNIDRSLWVYGHFF